MTGSPLENFQPFLSVMVKFCWSRGGDRVGDPVLGLAPVFGSYFFRPRKIMSRTLPPCTSLVLAGSSGFCGSPQEARTTPLAIAAALPSVAAAGGGGQGEDRRATNLAPGSAHGCLLRVTVARAAVPTDPLQRAASEHVLGALDHHLSVDHDCSYPMPEAGRPGSVRVDIRRSVAVAGPATTARRGTRAGPTRHRRRGLGCRSLPVVAVSAVLGAPAARPRSFWSSTTLRMRTVSGVTSMHSSSRQNSSDCSSESLRGGTSVLGDVGGGGRACW